ncbi:phosphoglycerate mutase-like protein [Durotheca rogersii]|uniref:phosphoglycerate mutase-like protein n=1 Tax=Durotheca rogersii TaxID=419775 RepID=UPI00221FE833|nr:phosphoglycerate mutase-like protein [Durotheca rogersii]KAI5865046.1 phosphoglycerate mutase-like protein [Durotheca rogersii]
MALKALVVSLAALPFAKGETVLGVYIFHRHGDRTPKSLAPVNLTALGADEAFQSGGYYRSRYIAADASSPILGLSHDIAVSTQLNVISPPDSVLQTSAIAFLQGAYPPVGVIGIQELANSSSVQYPLGGYQYIPVEAVATASSNPNSENNEWLQGGSGCGNAMVSSNNYFQSAAYARTLEETRAFYGGLLPVIGGVFSPAQANFKNGYTIFDYINVATVHNVSIPGAELLTDATMRRLKLLADEHEWNLAYNETEPIRAVAGSTLAAQVVAQLSNTLASGGRTPLSVQFGAYASFMSFFGLAGLGRLSDDFTGIVGYASSMAFELVTNASGVGTGGSYPAPEDVAVRFLLANGSAAEAPPREFPLFGTGRSPLPWPDFAAEMAKFAIGDTAAWCAACGNTTGLCADEAITGGSGSGSHGDAAAAPETSTNAVSLPVAGVIGALVALVVVLGLEAFVYAVAGLRLVRKSTLASLGAAGAASAGAAADKKV